MKHNHFTYKELLSFGWLKTKEHFGYLISLVVGSFVIGLITGGIPLVGNIIAGLTTLAFLAALFVITSGKKPTYKDLLTPFVTYKVTLHYFLASILYVVIVFVGIILLVLPGLYAAVRLQFYPYLIVEHENLNAIDALKKSWEMTRGRFWKLVGFMFVIGVLNLLGLLALGLGLLFTIPVTAVAYTELYKKLSPHHNTKAETVSE